MAAVVAFGITMGTVYADTRRGPSRWSTQTCSSSEPSPPNPVPNTTPQRRGSPARSLPAPSIAS